MVTPREALALAVRTREDVAARLLGGHTALDISDRPEYDEWQRACVAEGDARRTMLNA